MWIRRYHNQSLPFSPLSLYSMLNPTQNLYYHSLVILHITGSIRADMLAESALSSLQHMKWTRRPSNYLVSKTTLMLTRLELSTSVNQMP